MNRSSTIRGDRLKRLVSSSIHSRSSMIFDDRADCCRWDRPVVTIQTGAFPAQLAFHAYDPHLAVANEGDSITCVLNEQISRVTR